MNCITKYDRVMTDKIEGVSTRSSLCLCLCSSATFLERPRATPCEQTYLPSAVSFLRHRDRSYVKDGVAAGHESHLS